jgi:lipopolysaccharide export system permease protein
MILRRYILKSMIGPFWLGFGVITFLLTMDMLLDLLDLLISKGIPAWTVLQLFVLGLGWMVVLSIPCGVLVAALMTFGRLSQDNEIIALRASGVHLARIILPTLGSSVIVAVALALFNNYVLPETNYAFAGLMQEISRQRPTAEIREGVLVDDFRGYDLWIGRLDDRTGRMRDILILDARDNPDSPRTIMARSGTLKYRPSEGVLVLDLEDGEVHEADPAAPDGAYRRMHFQTQSLTIDDSSDRVGPGRKHQRSQREMSVAMMQAEVLRLRREGAKQDSLVRAALAPAALDDPAILERVDPTLAAPSLGRAILAVAARVSRKAPAGIGTELTADQRRWVELASARRREQMAFVRRAAEFRVEIQKKFSIPFACIVFVLVGAPLGILARRGGLAAGFFSAVFFVFYYLCLTGGEQLADRQLMSPWLAMWLPNIVIGGLGAWLTARAVTGGLPAHPRKGRAG